MTEVNQNFTVEHNIIPGCFGLFTSLATTLKRMLRQIRSAKKAMPIISTSVIMGPTSLESNPQETNKSFIFRLSVPYKTLLCLLSTIDKGINLCKHYFAKHYLDIDLTVLITSQFIMKLFVMFRQFLISCSRSRRRAVQTGVNTFITTLSMM